MSVSISSPPTTALKPVPTLPPSENKANQKKFHGFVAGVTSGVTKLVVGHPFDTIKVRMQTSGADRFRGPWHCLTETIRKEGPRALYKGATPPLIGWAFMDSVMLGSLSYYRLILQGGDPNVRLTPFWSGVAGIGAGVTVSFIAAPIEHIKARLQIQYDAKTKLYAGPIDCARQLVRNNGVTGLWKGLSATLWFRSWFFMWWCSYEIYATQMRKYTNMSEAAVNFWAGGLGANTFWVFAFPCDVVKNKIMTQPDVKNPPFPSMVSCFKHIYRTDGLKGFYRGFLPCLLRAFPTNACALTSFELTMRWLRKIDE
ncbi:solute carrier family 25 (mitochondrial carnitine/acylcarnitine transporter), member 20/29 [Entomortierella parvispora]|uniref:Solute carrier family 25 (Mitochondrial carnitine/acylcarnitine transporter), member 20/29 n=1 Tax=Entomortierella parvispora TaxID=205924 RepID=A0A9P3HHZ9_9FUNG|nr:solute carrier family 25 (mitochondrial carnitine/acylcarnitine transporter), member 20/29 [Entomortierella parvispora]